MNTLDFGNILRDLREKSGMTQKQLAARVGVTKESISLYELHERMPQIGTLCEIASVFRVSIDYLIGRDKARRIDLSGLTEKEIEITENLVEFFRENKKH